MKTIKIATAIILAGLLTLPFLSKAQDGNTPDFSADPTYRTAIGVRAGGTSGLTIKHFTGANTALEGIVGVWPNALGLTLLVERHVNAFNEPGLNWYYGAGGHVAFAADRYYYEAPRGYRYRYYGDYVGAGVDGILGIEYKIVPIPFAISLDLKPFVEVNTNSNVYVGLDPGLGIKVAF